MTGPVKVTLYCIIESSVSRALLNILADSNMIIRMTSVVDHLSGHRLNWGLMDNTHCDLLRISYPSMTIFSETYISSSAMQVMLQMSLFFR
jgi:hypothetical protein